MIWIPIGIALIMSAWAAWGTWQNTMSIKAIMKVIEEYEQMVKDVLQKEKGATPQ